MTTLAAALATRPLVLDGGFATQLEAQGADLSGDLWSAQLIETEPDQIVAAHAAFLAAGADVIETATYQATFEGFARHGIDRAHAERIMRHATDLARQAVESYSNESHKAVYVAASVGPYGAMLADGSEYTGAYDCTVEQLRDFHLPRLEVLSNTNVDVIALETIPNLTEVAAVVAASDEFDTPVWISICAADSNTRAGEPLADAFALAATARNVVAMGVNCSSAADAGAAIELAAVHGLPIVVYPNSGEGWDAEARSWTGAGDFDAMNVNAWVDAGARLIGGCCRVTPAHIGSIATAMASDR